MGKLYFDDYDEFAEFIYAEIVDQGENVFVYCDPVDIMELVRQLIVTDVSQENVLYFDYFNYDGVDCPEYNGPYLLIIADGMITCEKGLTSDGRVLSVYEGDVYVTPEFADEVSKVVDDESCELTIAYIGETPEDEEEEEPQEFHGTMALLFDTPESNNLVGFEFHGKDEDEGVTFDAKMTYGEDFLPDAEALCDFIAGFLKNYNNYMGYEED